MILAESIKKQHMKTFFYILAFLVWLVTFVIGCMAFGQVITMSNPQEAILSVLFIGSLIYMRIKKLQPSWIRKLDSF